MKTLTFLNLLLFTTLLVLVIPTEKVNIQDIIIEGPSSVSAINTDFETQEELDQVFTNWVNKFSFDEKDCQNIITDLSQYTAPSIQTGGTITIDFQVKDNCNEKISTRIASFELVVIDDNGNVIIPNQV